MLHIEYVTLLRAQRGGSARDVRASELWDRLPSHLPHWKCDRRSAPSEWGKKNCIFKINFQKIQKNLNFMVDKHNSQWYYNWAVANNCFWKTNNWKEFQKNEIHSWQKTEDMIKYPSRQQNDNKILTQKCLKNLKKVLDKQKEMR